MKNNSQFDFTSDSAQWSDEDLTLISIRLKSYIVSLMDKKDVNWQKRARIVSCVEDILAESLLRAIDYQQKAERGEVPPVRSFEGLCKWHAGHVLIDTLRKDKHISGTLDENFFQDGATITVMIVDDPCELVITALHNYSRMQFIATETQKLSPKQKEAWLIHIANNATLGNEEPYSFERAFQEVGISLHKYCCKLPSDLAQRKCYNSHLCLARKAIGEAIRRQGCYLQYEAA